jgi:hypothetical protein
MPWDIDFACIDETYPVVRTLCCQNIAWLFSFTGASGTDTPTRTASLHVSQKLGWNFGKGSYQAIERGTKECKAHFAPLGGGF